MSEYNAVITFGDKRIECEITELNITSESMGDYNPVYAFGDGRTVISQQVHTHVEMTGIVKELINNYEEKKMTRNCDEGVMCGESDGNTLTEKYNNLDLKDSRQVLVKHRLVRANGVLTDRGIDFLLNYLLRANEDQLAEAVKKVEASDKKKTEQ